MIRELLQRGTKFLTGSAQAIRDLQAKVASQAETIALQREELLRLRAAEAQARELAQKLFDQIAAAAKEAAS